MEKENKNCEDLLKTIILCGSMKLKNKIFKVQKELEAYGFCVLLPEECIRGVNKQEASRAHFDRIVQHNAYILIVNEEKNNIPNYIGANSLCEIAFGFYHKKKVFLLCDIYEPYRDELEGWRVIPLKGDLNKLVSY